MEENPLELYCKRVIRLVKSEENLWNSSHNSYENTAMEQTSWNSIAAKLNILCGETFMITVENVKFTWNSLKESYEECKQYKTAIKFSLFYELSFIDKDFYLGRHDYDGLFTRKKGKYLVLLQIILNMLFLGFGFYVLYATTPMKEDTLYYSEFIRMFILVGTAASFLMALDEPFRADQQDIALLIIHSILVFPSIVIWIILHFTGYDFWYNDNANKTFNLVIISFLTMVCQIFVTMHHSLKLDRPPTIIEMSNTLANELILAITFVLALFTSQWTEFYIVMLAWILTNFFILLGYYHICWKHAKILYKFRKTCRLVAVHNPEEEPYKIRFEIREE